MPGRPPRKTRPYHRSGRHVVKKALPYLLARVANPTIPEDALSPVELAARAWRQEVIEDLGGAAAVPATKAALLDAVTGTKVILDSLDRYVFELATEDGLVSRKYRRAFAVVLDRMRVADGLARQLQALGLERAAPSVPDLATYLAQRPRGRQAVQAPPGAHARNGHAPTVNPETEDPHPGAEAPVEP
jgi:hypothetical protein